MNNDLKIDLIKQITKSISGDMACHFNDETKELDMKDYFAGKAELYVDTIELIVDYPAPSSGSKLDNSKE